MVIENTYCWSPLQAVMFGLGPREIPKVGVSKNWSVQEMTGLGSFTAPNSWGGGSWKSPLSPRRLGLGQEFTVLIMRGLWARSCSAKASSCSLRKL